MMEMMIHMMRVMVEAVILMAMVVETAVVVVILVEILMETVDHRTTILRTTTLTMTMITLMFQILRQLSTNLLNPSTVPPSPRPKHASLILLTERIRRNFATSEFSANSTSEIDPKLFVPTRIKSRILLLPSRPCP
jgi:hypothetical protein